MKMALLPPLAFRQQQGRPLSIEEMDNNFKNLDARLRALESVPLDTENIAEASVDGDLVTLKGSRGTVFGSFTLPHTSWEARGAWQAHMPYKIQDIVQHEHALFVCDTPHISPNSFSQEGFWKEVFSLDIRGDAFDDVSPAHTAEISPLDPIDLPCYTASKLPTLQETEQGKLVFVKDQGPQYWDGHCWQALISHAQQAKTQDKIGEES